jgi:hypothetical protein
MKKTTTCDVENLGPGLEQEQKWDGFKPVNRIPILPILIIGSPTNTAINIPKKACTEMRPLKKNTYYHNYFSSFFKILNVTYLFLHLLGSIVVMIVWQLDL